MKTLVMITLSVWCVLALFTPTSESAEANRTGTIVHEKTVEERDYARDGKTNEKTLEVCAHVIKRLRRSGNSTGHAYVFSQANAEVLQENRTYRIRALIRGSADTSTFAVPDQRTSQTHPAGREKVNGKWVRRTAHIATDAVRNRKVVWGIAYTGWKELDARWTTNDPLSRTNGRIDFEFHGLGNKSKSRGSSQSLSGLITWVKNNLTPIAYTSVNSPLQTQVPELYVHTGQKATSECEEEEEEEEEEAYVPPPCSLAAAQPCFYAGNSSWTYDRTRDYYNDRRIEWPVNISYVSREQGWEAIPKREVYNDTESGWRVVSVTNERGVSNTNRWLGNYLDTVSIDRRSDGELCLKVTIQSFSSGVYTILLRGRDIHGHTREIQKIIRMTNPY